MSLPYTKARLRDIAGKEMLKLYDELGEHLGNCIKMIMYTYDPRLIVLGGSVRHAYDFFEEAMWKRIRTCAFSKSAEVSDTSKVSDTYDHEVRTNSRA